MIRKFLEDSNLSEKIYYRLASIRARGFVKQIEGYLNKADRILDIGCGTCIICEILKEKGYNATPLDIENLSMVWGIKPVVYNGRKLPFRDNEFDVSLILTVLHHTASPAEVVKEAGRVSRRIVVIEDIYTGRFHRALCYLAYNLLAVGQPPSLKTDKEWQTLFRGLGLNLKDVKYCRSCLVFRHAVYCLEKKSPDRGR